MINFKNFQNFKKDPSITNKWGELFLPLYLAAVESHLLGFIRTKGEIDGFALITNLAFGVLQSQVDGDDVAALTGDVTTHRNLRIGGHHRLLVLHVELHRHTRGLQFAVDDPACHFIHQHTDDSAMQGIDPALLILAGIPDGKHILTLFPKLKMQSYRIVGGTANAVVTLLVQIWI